ncbi:DNRLRE domain-containing protein [Streptomyces sp. INA 01156]
MAGREGTPVPRHDRPDDRDRTDADDGARRDDLLGRPGTNYDDNWRLSVGNTSSGSSRALLRFPLSQIPAGTRVEAADLKLYYDQTHTTSGEEVQLQAHRATQEWKEETATWDSAQDITGELSGTSVVVDDGDAGRTAAVGAWPALGTPTTRSTPSTATTCTTRTRWPVMRTPGSRVCRRTAPTRSRCTTCPPSTGPPTPRTR